MREVTPKELREYNDKSFKDTQKFFRRRLREIAASGRASADFDKGHFCCEDKIITWLRSLGFKVTPGTYKYYITWPEEEDIIEKLRKESFKILTQPMPAKVHYAIGWLNSESKKKAAMVGEWIFDSHCYDYVCSECSKHSEYTSPYCPNCGKELKPVEGRKYDTE